jgi:hypothetical protein
VPKISTAGGGGGQGVYVPSDGASSNIDTNTQLSVLDALNNTGNVAPNLGGDPQLKLYKMQNERAFYSAFNSSPRQFVK